MNGLSETPEKLDGTLLGVVISGIICNLTIIITHIRGEYKRDYKKGNYNRGLITLLITTHEPPSGHPEEAPQKGV